MTVRVRVRALQVPNMQVQAPVQVRNMQVQMQELQVPNIRVPQVLQAQVPQALRNPAGATQVPIQPNGYKHCLRKVRQRTFRSFSFP